MGQPAPAPAESPGIPWWSAVLVFVALGPLIGTVVMVLAMMASGSAAEHAFTTAALLFAVGFYVGYLFGGVPAMLTGIAAAVLLRTRLRRGPFVALVTLVGWALVLLPIPFLGLGWTPSFWGLVGAVPAFCCAWIVWTVNAPSDV